MNAVNEVLIRDIVGEVLGRRAGGMKDAPVDAVIIGIVDSVDVLGKEIFNARQ